MNEKYGLEQVSVRIIREAPLLSDEKIQNPQDAIRILGDVFKDYDREVVGVVHLRSDNVPINMTIVSIGCINQSLVHPREMLKAAFLSNASSIMMFHNHPSGSLVPSREDIAITNRMQQLCMLAGVPVVDHIIIGQKEFYYFFREKDILPMDDIRYSTDLSDVDLKVAEKKAEKYGYQKMEATNQKKSIKASLAEKKKLTQAGKSKTPAVKKTKSMEL